MGLCGNCGKVVVDDESYKKAYCSVLESSGKDRHLLKGFIKLFDNYTMYNVATREYTAIFDDVDIARLGLNKFFK